METDYITLEELQERRGIQKVCERSEDYVSNCNDNCDTCGSWEYLTIEQLRNRMLPKREKEILEQREIIREKARNPIGDILFYSGWISLATLIIEIKLKLSYSLLYGSLIMASAGALIMLFRREK